MSRDFIDRKQQYYNTDNNSSESTQKKIDPVAQLKWLESPEVYQNWGLFNSENTAQLLADENRKSQLQETGEELQMKPGEALRNAINRSIQARFGNPVVQEKELPINSDPELEKEADIMGEKAAQGKMADVTGKGGGVQRQVEEKEPSGNESESTTSYLDAIEPTNDDNLYTAFYNDIAIYSTPEGESSENVLEVEKKYKVVNKCKIGENNFYEVKKDGEESSVGWIKDYEYVLYGNNTTDREDKLKKFKDWLKERLTEAETKTGNDKIKFVQGILGLIEKESANIAKDPPVYPNVETLDKSPSYSETDNPDLNAAVPHELISITREFINITELTPETVDADAETVTGGSRYSNNDWNSRLGAPQYRTQSDNMSIPEATCNVTTMAMTLERLGNSRTDVISAIDTKLKNGEEKTDAQLKTLWEEKSKAYLEKITSVAGSGYQKLRGNNGGLVGKEGDLSKKFKEIAQMEDLLDFYMYLKTTDLSKRYNIFDNTYNDVIPEDINFSTEDEYSTERINIGAINVRFNYEHRNKIKETLDGGGSVVLSVYHKGSGTKSHIISVQSINSEGLVVDDPYGGQAQDYRFGETGDLYKGKGKTDSRSNYNFRNVAHYNSIETDYSKRDFTAEAAQNLEEDESRGDSILLKYEMINKSTSEFINYIVLYEKK